MDDRDVDRMRITFVTCDRPPKSTFVRPGLSAVVGVYDNVCGVGDVATSGTRGEFAVQHSHNTHHNPQRTSIVG